MHKLITITVLIAVLALGAESFRVPRQVEGEGEDEEKGTVATVLDTLKSYYDQGLNTASGYIENIKELKLEEKAKSLLDETTQAVRTYFGIVQDQLYHIVYTQESH
ncbi:apolipoprotein C-II [Colossoma macropomum]|uniref:apolipoprotein C-II n=1 Tax=Colossoma macropomum TaxID=42526 RepID=UPI0018652660|nr:apolipoprotein C-II [Colossoma macropomum]